ncbi:MAG: acyl-ACP--UDP-N-acetylglucosamine O-acyltransferase [Phycisphaerae bacterium]
MPIHATAIIDRQAEVDSSADIGPFVVIEGAVRIGPRCKIYPNAYLSGWTELGADVQVHPNAVVGHLPQDFHFSGERSYCRIGDGTIIREGASVHRGTQPESWTTVGKNCFILASAHIGHNCVVGDGAKIYNCAALSGHVEVGQNAIVSGYSLVHQFVRIGDYVMIGGGSRITKDVPHFFAAYGESECYGYNVIGLRRSGQFSTVEIAEVKLAYRTLYRSGLLFRAAVEELAAAVQTRTGRAIVAFLTAPSKRGIVGPSRNGSEEADASASV